MRILITDGIDENTLETLQRDHSVTNMHIPAEDLGPTLADFDAVILRSATQISASQMAQGVDGRLKLIIRGGVGMDNIDTHAAAKLGIKVINTPAASTNAVAEMTIGLLFSCARHLCAADRSMRRGKWEKKTYADGMELAGKTLGIIGYGKIGRRVGEIAKGIGMRTLAFDIEPNNSETCVPLETLLKQADVISIHTPALRSPIIHKKTVEKMKDGVIVINTSRGCNVDEIALLDGLNSGKIRAAGLDVWVQEPPSNASLISHPRICCTPHLSASTMEAQARIGQEILQIIREFSHDYCE